MANDAEEKDRALVIGATADAAQLLVLRQRARGVPVEVGVVRPLEQGRPIHGEVVRLKPDTGRPLLCDVEVQVAAPRAPGTSRVANAPYREGWDRVFSPKLN